MRHTGYVVVTNDKDADHWEVFVGNGAVLLGNDLLQMRQLLINEIELNEPGDWSPEYYRVMDLATGQLLAWSEESNKFYDAVTGTLINVAVG